MCTRSAVDRGQDKSVEERDRWVALMFQDLKNEVCWEFPVGHPNHGEIRYPPNQSCPFIRIEYVKGHSNHGEQCFFDASSPEPAIPTLHHKTFQENHIYHGKIHFFHAGCMVRGEYLEGYEEHGRIEYFKGDPPRLCRIRYAPGHRRYGETTYYDSDPLRVTLKRFSKDYYEEDMRFQDCYFDSTGDGRHTHIIFTKGHKYYGLIYDCDTKKLLPRETANVGKLGRKGKTPLVHCSQCGVGSFVTHSRDWVCDNCFYSKSSDGECKHSDSSQRVPAYYQDGEVSVEKKRTEAELAELAQKRRERRVGWNDSAETPVRIRPSPTKNGKQKVKFASFTSDSAIQRCRDIIATENRKNQKQCPTCANWLSKTVGGGNHICCTECKTEFCFLCLERLKGHKVASTGAMHFGLVCPQHGGTVV